MPDAAFERGGRMTDEHAGIELTRMLRRLLQRERGGGELTYHELTARTG
jgi:hypothetical protein